MWWRQMDRHNWRQVFKNHMGPFLSIISILLLPWVSTVSCKSRFKNRVSQTNQDSPVPDCAESLIAGRIWLRTAGVAWVLGLKIRHVASFLFWFLVFLTQHFKPIQTYSLCKSLISFFRMKNGCKCGFDFSPPFYSCICPFMSHNRFLPLLFPLL